ncbi:hypothetical protein EPA93_29570 [Ktedonosporobacter rubrisoli]|uniref:Uncharacterized protein n=1 Tax=Ktedonosporobacter rubrisoli TaxID=2509675 RepID=A0A4P6JY03_KTERU|nr:hypothetical protein [Ktedonosporobacter rubrisoli]QBD79906.1 hypothetical protein EPA93_29570 [Ktedonosporobacter rubrisoli]
MDNNFPCILFSLVLLDALWIYHTNQGFVRRHVTHAPRELIAALDHPAAFTHFVKLDRLLALCSNPRDLSTYAAEWGIRIRYRAPPQVLLNCPS